jgi:hypothetical protein
MAGVGTLTATTVNAALNGTLGATTPSTVAATTISASGVSTFSAGSAGAPAITTAGDTNTGIFFPAADTIAFAEGGVESMRLDSSGNLGLGATTVQGATNIERSSSAGTVAATSSIVLSNRNSTSGTFVAGGIFSNTYRDISTTEYTAGVWFEKQNSTVSSSSASQGAIVFGANDFLASAAIPTERMRITSTGNVGIGTATPNVSGQNANTKIVTIQGLGNYWGGVEVSNSSPAAAALLGFYGFTSSGSAAGYTMPSYIGAWLDSSGTATKLGASLRFFTQPDNTAGASERMRLDSSGRLGITTTPSAWAAGFSVIETIGGSLTSGGNFEQYLGQNYYYTGASGSRYVSSNPASSYGQASGVHTWYTAVGGVAGALVNGTGQLTTIMTLNASGNLGLGVTPSAWGSNRSAMQLNARMAIWGDTSSSLIGNNVYGSASGDTYIATASASLYAQYAGVHAWYNAPSGTAGNAITFTQAMTLDASGRLMINQTSPSVAGAGDKIQINGELLTTGSLSGLFFENRSGGVTAGTNWYGWYSTGTIYMFNGASNIASINASTGAYTALSDVNKKKDFEPSLLGLNEILQLKPTLYRMKDAEDDSPKELGLIAQEVKDVIPQAYFENTSLDAVGKESTFIGLNDRAIVATLVKAIQEQQAMIDELKAKVAALEAA